MLNFKDQINEIAGEQSTNLEEINKTSRTKLNEIDN